MSAANQNEGSKLIPIIESINVKQRKGRLRTRPKLLYADTKYNMPLNKFYLDRKKIRSHMPDSPGKKKRAGRPRAFRKSAYYHAMSMIERFNEWTKAFRRMVTRYDRLPSLHEIRSSGIHHGLSEDIAMNSRPTELLTRDNFIAIANNSPLFLCVFFKISEDLTSGS
ncbi:MAG: hypothetical protein QW292_04640 [Candidatus Parvarchaeota archaeon]